MKKLMLVTAVTGLGLLVGWLVAAPASLNATTHILSQRESVIIPSGRYVNVDAGYGSAELTFLGHNRYTYGDDGSVSAEGTFSIAGDQITFIEYGPADAGCLRQRGIYAWTLMTKTLMLKAIQDPCATRQYDWQSGEWFRERDSQ